MLFLLEVMPFMMSLTVADPGFPVGGGANLRHVHFLAKTYAKMKEMDPVGGGRRRRPLDPPMTNFAIGAML